MSLFSSSRGNSGRAIALSQLEEETMHIHGNSMNINAASLYSSAQNEKTAAAQRAAEVRKKLLKERFGHRRRIQSRRSLYDRPMDGWAP